MGSLGVNESLGRHIKRMPHQSGLNYPQNFVFFVEKNEDLQGFKEKFISK